MHAAELLEETELLGPAPLVARVEVHAPLAGGAIAPATELVQAADVERAEGGR